MSLEDILSLQRKRMGLHGGYSTDDELNMSMFDSFEDNPAYQIITHNNKKVGVHFIKKQTRFGEIELYIIPKPDYKIGVGDYITDRYENVWICTQYEDYPIIKNSITPCNHMLTFQRNERIYKLPCVLMDKTSVYSSGIDNGKILAIANDQIMVLVPDNDITKMISTDERFIFMNDKNAIYKSTKTDRLLNMGVLQIKMKHDTYNPNTDNLELNIANYKKSENPTPETPSEPISINIKGESSINIFTSPQDYTIEIYQDGEIVNKKVEFVLSNNLATIISQDGYACSIKMNSNYNYGKVILKATLIENKTIYAEKEISITSF